jgi:hypothetical protein
MDEQINRLVIIKTIGLTTLIITGSFALWTVLQLIATFIFDNALDRFTAGQTELEEAATEMGDTINQVRLLWLAGFQSLSH